MSTNDEQDPRRTVETFLEVFSSGDVDRTLELLTDDVTWWVAGSLEGLSGTLDKEGVRAVVGGAGEAAVDGAVRLTATGWTVDGDRVAVEARSDAPLRNGRTYRNEYHFLFRVRDGRIAQVKEYSDTQHVAEVFLAP
ncbi:nuclear transport factor 2 family protein [Patulibacter sp. S7RM1-6]